MELAPAPAPANATPQNLTPGPEELSKLVATMQSRVSHLSSDLEFSVDDDSGKSIIKVTERATKDVIWQFPSEQALQVTRELDRFQSMLSRKV
jgi:flagellar protein FlaG